MTQITKPVHYCMAHPCPICLPDLIPFTSSKRNKSSWEGCPVCKGTGKGNIIDWALRRELPKCKTCNGKGIINSFNGTPPPF